MFYSLNVLQDLKLADYVSGDPRIYLTGHKANSLFKDEVKQLVNALGDDFPEYFEAGDEATAALLETL